MRDIQDSLLVDYAEDEGVLPALLFGWDAAIDKAAPEFVVQVGHQFGGHACRQALLAGLLLPLHGNLSRARHDPTPLLEALRTIAESQQDGTSHRTASSLRLFDDWGYTGGRDMAAADLAGWDAMLGQHYHLPPLVGGAEALLEFGPADASGLIGWQAVAAADRGMQGLVTVEPSSLEAIAECRPSDRASNDAKLYLLWENSD